MTNTMNIMPLSPLHLEEEDDLESSDGSEGESRDEYLSDEEGVQAMGAS